MRVGEMPEKQFIAEVLSRYALTAATNEFEDCIIIELGGGPTAPAVVLNVDHPSYTRKAFRDLDDYRFYGRWAAAGVCGDVISMGVRPSGFAIDLSVPLELEVEQVEAIYEGVTEVLSRYGARLMGGNLDANRLEIVGVAWGIGRLDRLVRRRGARAGDIVVATCNLGVGWAAYLADRRELLGRLPPELAELARTYKDHTFAPIEPILELAEAGVWTSGMDLSDGLIEFLFTIAQRNGLGVEVDERALGHHALIEQVGALVGARPAAFALDPGYDFPFAHGYTAPASARARIEETFRRHGAEALVVAEVVAEPGVRLRRAAGAIELPAFWSDQTDSGAARVERWFQRIAAAVA